MVRCRVSELSPVSVTNDDTDKVCNGLEAAERDIAPIDMLPSLRTIRLTAGCNQRTAARSPTASLPGLQSKPEHDKAQAKHTLIPVVEKSRLACLSTTTSYK